MSDNIWNDSFVESHRAAWHNLGHVEQCEDATAALHSINGDYTVEMVPQFYMTQDGVQVQSEQYVIRRPAWQGEPERVFGYASKEYRPLQNREVCRMLDQHTKEWGVETAGLLDHGKGFFITLDAGFAQVGGDEIRKYIFLWNTHDATSKFKAMMTPQRVVCENTCIMGERVATVNIQVKHTQNVLAEAQFALNTVATIRHQMDESIAALDKLTKFKLTHDQVKAIVEKIHPIAEPSEQMRTLEAMNVNSLSEDEKTSLHAMRAQLAHDRQVALQNQVMIWTAYQTFNQQFSGMANTGWSLYNCFTGNECHKPTAGRQTVQAVSQSILFGERAKVMASAYTHILAASRR